MASLRKLHFLFAITVIVLLVNCRGYPLHQERSGHPFSFAQVLQGIWRRQKSSTVVIINHQRMNCMVPVVSQAQILLGAEDFGGHIVELRAVQAMKVQITSPIPMLRGVLLSPQCAGQTLICHFFGSQCTARFSLVFGATFLFCVSGVHVLGLMLKHHRVEAKLTTFLKTTWITCGCQES